MIILKSIKIYIIFLFYFFIFAFHNSAYCKTYKFATTYVPLMVESKDKGIFIELSKEIIRRINIEIEIIIEPTIRTSERFNNKNADIIFPATDVMLRIPFLRTITVYYKNDFSFYKSEKPYKTLKDLEGKNVGLTLGYGYVKALTENNKISFQMATSDIVNMRKLAAGRLDAFIVEEHSGLKALRESKVKGITYDRKYPLSSQEIYFAFQKTNEGKMLADKFKKALKVMKKDGTFDRIMKDTAGAK